MIKKTLKELTIRDNFMFGAVMSDESICREFLEIALGIPIGRVVVDREKSMVYHPEYKGIRLDVYAKDENRTLFNVEMQVVPKTALGRRARYYSSELDMQALLTGKEYKELPDSYVIFVCDFDPFGLLRYRYTFAHICREDTELELGDECRIVFLSTHGSNRSEVPEALVHFLDYVRTDPDRMPGEPEDGFVDRLRDAVRAVKASREMEGRFMILQEMMQEEREEGRKEGLKEGLEEGRKEGLKEGLKEGRKEGLEEGRKEGRISTLVEYLFMLLENMGEMPPELKEQIESQTDPAVLKRWFGTASRAASIEEFRAGML